MRRILIILFLLLFPFNIAFADQTRAQLRTAVRALINETDSINSNFTDTQVNDALNYGLDYLSDALPESVQLKLISVVSSTAPISTEYVSLPSGFKKVISVELYGKQAIPIKLEEVYTRRLIMSSTDPYYYVLGTSLYLIPANTGGTNSYKMVWLKKPTLMTNDSATITASYDVELEPVLCLIAASYLLALDGQINKATGFDTVIAKKLSAYIEFMTGTNVAGEPNKAGEAK